MASRTQTLTVNLTPAEAQFLVRCATSVFAANVPGAAVWCARPLVEHVVAKLEGAIAAQSKPGGREP